MNGLHQSQAAPLSQAGVKQNELWQSLTDSLESLRRVEGSTDVVAIPA